ncbi:MAG TPA: hypothetical protein VIO94_05860 [Phenylobacterium sp.]
MTLGISVTGALHSVRTPKEREEAINVLGRLFSEGKFSMPIDCVVPFGEAVAALDSLGGGVNGKRIARVSHRQP